MITFIASAALAAASPTTQSAAPMAGMTHEPAMDHSKMDHSQMDQSKTAGMACCKKGCCADKTAAQASKHKH